MMSQMMSLLFFKHRRKEGKGAVHLMNVLLVVVVAMILTVMPLLARRSQTVSKVTQKYGKCI